MMLLVIEFVTYAGARFSGYFKYMTQRIEFQIEHRVEPPRWSSDDHHDE